MASSTGREFTKEYVMSDQDWKAGKTWAIKHPNGTPPPKSHPDFIAGAKSTKK